MCKYVSYVCAQLKSIPANSGYAVLKDTFRFGLFLIPSELLLVETSISDSTDVTRIWLPTRILKPIKHGFTGNVDIHIYIPNGTYIPTFIYMYTYLYLNSNKRSFISDYVAVCSATKWAQLCVCAVCPLASLQKYSCVIAVGVKTIPSGAKCTQAEYHRTHSERTVRSDCQKNQIFEYKHKSSLKAYPPIAGKPAIEPPDSSYGLCQCVYTSFE